MSDLTNPNNYGPEQGLAGGISGVPGTNIRYPQPVRQPIADVTAPMKDALNGLDPEMAYLIDSIGRNVGSRGNADLLMKQAFTNGETVDSMRKTVQAAEASDNALRLAEQSMHLSDDEFNQVLGQIQQETMNPPQVPTPGQVQFPGRVEMGLAALLSLTTPEFAFSIGSVPFQNQQRIRDEAFQQAMQKYGADMAQRAQRLDLLDTRLKIADRRRSEAADEVRRLADQAFREGETRKAQGLQLRGQLYDSQSEAELNDRLEVLRRSYPEQVPDMKVISGIRNDLKAKEQALQDKAKFEKDKADADYQEKKIDDFREWVNSNYPAGSSLGPKEIAAIKAEAARVAKETGIPVSKFSQYGERTAPATQNADFAQQRYQEEAPMRDLQYNLGQALLDERKANLKKTLDNDPSKAGKRKRIAALDTKIQNARIEVDALDNQPVPTDPDEYDKYAKKVQEAWATELALVQMKRKEIGAKVPTASEYIKERYPEKAGGLFGQIGRAVSGQASGKPPLSNQDRANMKKANPGKGGLAPISPAPPPGFGQGVKKVVP